MYFPDLTEYNYLELEPNTYNIGWLSIQNPYPTGKVLDDILARLKRYLRFPINSTFGGHECEFCLETGVSLSMSAEIRVLDLNGVAFAAPRMIYHYITIHNYLPPQVFIDAVLLGPEPGSDKYKEIAQSFHWFSDLL